MRRLAVGTLALLSLACGATGPVDGTWRGVYVQAFESSSFMACGGDHVWWMTGELGPIAAAWPDEVPPLHEARAAVVIVRGERSPRGDYGHLGAYPYELRVREVLEVDVDTTGACE